jgi:PKD repeat protein
MGEEVLEQFRRFRRRHLWVRGWDLFLEAAFVLSVTAGAMLLVDRLAFELGLARPHLSTAPGVAAALLGTLLLAALLAGALLALRPTRPAEIAWRLDRVAGGEERFLSALELASAGDGGPFAGALFRDASRLAADAQPRDVLPGVPVGYRWGILLALCAGGVLAAFPPQVYGPPRADFEGSPLRGPAPLIVEFRDGSVGAIDEFRWEFGDGQEGSGERVVHVYEKPGRFSASLRIAGPGGDSRNSREVEVLPSDRAVAEFRAQPRKGRAPLEVRFENLSKNASRFEWDFGDGVKSGDADPLHVYDRPGLYTVRLRALNAAFADERVREKYVRAAHPDEPLADFAALPVAGEAPLAVYFEDRSTGSAAEHEWDFGDPYAGEEGASRERNPTHTYRQPGRYTVKLRVKGPHGEDEEEKVRYLHVREAGGGAGKGGGGKGAREESPRAAKDPQAGGAGREPGKLEAERTRRPQVVTVPEGVHTHQRGPGTTVKELQLLSPAPGGSGPPKDQPARTVIPRFQRAAEDSIERERIPPVVRDYIRRYYESFLPK